MEEGDNTYSTDTKENEISLTYPVTPFEDLIPTTMTVIGNLTAPDCQDVVSTDVVFTLLPITRIVGLPSITRKRSKIRMPKIIAEKAIIGIRYRNYRRGIIRSSSDKHFKNSITIDMVSNNKNLCIKLSARGVHVTGANSLEQVQIAIGKLIGFLDAIQGEIDYLQANKQVAITTYQKLIELCKGEELYRNDTTLHEEESAEFKVKDYRIKQVDIDSIEDKDFDKRIAVFLFYKAGEYMYHSHLSKEMQYVLSVTSIRKDGIRLENLRTSMVNINFDLGFDVDRFALAQNITGFDGFTAEYDQMHNVHVKIRLAYSREEAGGNFRQKKNKIPVHTFMVYYSGHVTQSGPNLQLMEVAYYRFWQAIQLLLSVVQKEHQRTRTIILKEQEETVSISETSQ